MTDRREATEISAIERSSIVASICVTSQDNPAYGRSTQIRRSLPKPISMGGWRQRIQRIELSRVMSPTNLTKPEIDLAGGHIAQRVVGGFPAPGRARARFAVPAPLVGWYVTWNSLKQQG